MDGYEILLTLLGVAFLGAAALPRVLQRTPVSLPMVYVAAGLCLPFLWPSEMRFEPLEHGVVTERLTELAVILSLAGAGLKLDRRLTLRAWRTPITLLAITMPLSILALALFGMYGLGLSLAGAVLLGAVMAPTDPVLASDVQVGPPGSGEDHETRFALTSEAGLNDGLAFPFVYLAILLASGAPSWELATEWLLGPVLWKIGCGTIAGVGLGALFGWLVFRVGEKNNVTDGFFVLTLTILTYGSTELLGGYGFLAVFVGAFTFRRFEHDHDVHEALHQFSAQIERLIMAVCLLLLGAAITHGLLVPLTPAAALVAVAFVVGVRPVAGYLGLLGCPHPWFDRAVIATLGIRGIGSFYYLAYGLNHGDFDAAEAELLWSIAGLIVVISVVLHGLTAPTLMNRVSPMEPDAG